MKTAIKLILIYIGMQIAAMMIVAIPLVIYRIATGEGLEGLNNMMMAPGMFLSMGMMILYLWKAGYISTEKVNWSVVSPAYLLLTVVIALPFIWVNDAVVTPLHLPDLMENAFNSLSTEWLGVLCIAIVGPVLEELIFRGAITRSLLKHYSPTTAIILSGVIFGVFHINPAQVVSAMLFGFLIAWVYYRTASLIPCILIHIINNSLSMYLMNKYPEVDTVNELVGGNQTYYLLTGIAVVILATGVYLMSRTNVKYPWKKSEPLEILTNNE